MSQLDRIDILVILLAVLAGAVTAVIVSTFIVLSLS